MQQEIYALRKAIIEIERNIASKDNDVLLKNIDEIIYLCQNLKNSLSQNNTVKIFESTNIDCKKINRISFIYKPLTQRNYFEGDYLVEFAEERTRELKEAGILDIHNNFWTDHKTIKGNVFGSVPKELINTKAENSLLKNGWREVDVNILDIKNRNINVKEIIKFCENNFEYYILIKEESTNTFLILQYEI